MGFLDIFHRLRAALPGSNRSMPTAPGETPPGSTETGYRTTTDELQLIQSRLWVDTRLLSVIRDIRAMDKLDGRVKKIHGRSARAAAKGGVRLKATGVPRLEREWRRFARATKLNNPQKLQSDLRGLLMEGHLAIQWVLGPDEQVAAGVRMPPETIKPLVNRAGVFDDPMHAYDQIEIHSGRVAASFALWQLSLGRVDPLNFDDWGSPGRPYLDASRGIWKKLDMTEEDLVVRRHMRAPQRMAHVLEGASAEELAAYREEVERDQAHGNFRDYYLNKKGAVSAVAGDAELDQIADVVHLLDSFAAGSPMPKGLFGYMGDLSRDILEDVKKDWYDELSAIQTVAASVYAEGFRLHLLLRGINPDSEDWDVEFVERLTDSPNQMADLALKRQALGASRETVFETAGLQPSAEKAALAREREEDDPYPLDEHEVDGDGLPLAPRGRQPRVSVTPGNAPKGESATSISSS